MISRITGCKCRLAAVLAVAALLHGCGNPQGDGAPDQAGDGPGTESSRPAAEPQEGELFLAAPPPGWKETGAMRTPALRMAEYGPPQVPDGRLERLTFEAQSGDPLPDPIEFVLGVSRDLDARCDEFQDLNISSGLENGYPTSVRLMICPVFEDSPYGQVVMAKAIQGNEMFYVITRRLRVPPMKDQGPPLSSRAMALWTTHLRGIQVCDTRMDEHPCPQPGSGDASADEAPDEAAEAAHEPAGEPAGEPNAPAETPAQTAEEAPSRS